MDPGLRALRFLTDWRQQAPKSKQYKLITLHRAQACQRIETISIFFIYYDLQQPHNFIIFMGRFAGLPRPYWLETVF